MSELNKYELKALKVFKPHIEFVQEFIDENIVGGNTMTVSVIFEKFCDEYHCDLDSDVFIKGFRSAVKAGKITGIESARKLGYRRIGEEAQHKSADDVAFEQFNPFLDSVIEIVDEKIQGNNRMTAADVYKIFTKKVDSDMSEEDFVKGFRLSIRNGTIKGLASAGRYGYRRAGASETTSFVDTDDTVSEIKIAPDRRITKLDRFNWGYQVLKGSTWVTEGYYPSTKKLMGALTSKLLDEELAGVRCSLEELPQKITEAEERLAEILWATMDNSSESEEEEESQTESVA